MTATGLGRRALAGISWTLLGALVSNASKIAVVAILSRLLEPGDFGVVAVAMTVVLFGQRFKELGFGLALVQRKEIDDAHVETTFAISMLLGFLLAGVLFIAAGSIAAAYDMPRAEDPIRALSALFVIRALSSTSRFLCQRELQFRALALIGVVSYLVGSAVSVALALADHALWALVIGYLVEAGVESALVLIVRPPRHWPRVNRTALGHLFRFGGGQMVAGFANYFANQGDYMVVGRFLGDVLLGAYNRAYELMRFPAQMFNTVAGTVLFSSFAKLQDDPMRLGQMYRRVLFVNAITLLPASAGLIVLAPEAIYLLLGSGWDSAVVPFQLMAVSMLFRTSYKAASLVARSAGDVARIALWQVAYAVAVIGGALISMRWGIVGVSVTTALAVMFHFANLTRLALRQTEGLTWADVVAAHRDGIVLAALVVAGALPTALVLRGADASLAMIAIAGTIAGSILPIGFGISQVRRDSPDWTWIVDRVRQVVRKKRKKQRDKA